MSEENMLNPQVVDVTIGIKKMRKIKIYPLSLSDEIKFTKKISESINAYVSAIDMENDVEIASLIAKLLSDNIGEIVGLVTDEDGESLVSEMTNTQVLEIAEIVYETNFGAITKNLKSLTAKMGLNQKSQPARQLPRSVKNMATRSRTSTKKDSSREASPEDN